MSILIENLKHIYNKGNPNETVALDGINLDIKQGELVAIIGHTGSGKSTLIQHLNGLLKATDGTINIDGTDITSKGVKLTEVRKKVGLVFQYPEYQLFEESIEKEVAFGPSNLNLDEAEILKRVKNALETVGLDYEEVKDKSPFELSGGQRRRVAIAGVIAMQPNILILDEPTAGLDPRGRDDLFKQIIDLHRANNTTVIIVSHSMEDVAKLVDRIIVMSGGKVVLDGSETTVFKNAQLLENIGLDVPEMTKFAIALREKNIDISEDVYDIESAKKEILRLVREKNNA